LSRDRRWSKSVRSRRPVNLRPPVCANRCLDPVQRDQAFRPDPGPSWPAPWQRPASLQRCGCHNGRCFLRRLSLRLKYSLPGLPVFTALYSPRASCRGRWPSRTATVVCFDQERVCHDQSTRLGNAVDRTAGDGDSVAGLRGHAASPSLRATAQSYWATGPWRGFDAEPACLPRHLGPGGRKIRIIAQRRCQHRSST